MKKIISIVLCVCFVFCLSSCDTDSVLPSTEKIIAVKYGSGNEQACEQYGDYTKVTYNSSSDVVLAIENSKADFGILDDFELASFLHADRGIKEKSVCEYSLDYCAYFTLENDALQKEFNKAINKLNNDGTLEAIKLSWLSGKEYRGLKGNNENGTLTMLCDPNFHNRVFSNDNGDVIGLDVDIAKAICNYLGYDLEIVISDFDQMFVKLQEGEGDFIMSACEVNEERAEYYLLSDSYFTLKFHLIERN